MGDIVVDEDGSNHSEDRCSLYKACAEQRERQLAECSNVVECRRPPPGSMKYAVGMVVGGANVPTGTRVLGYWSLEEKTALVGYTEGMCTLSRTHRMSRPFYLMLGAGITNWKHSSFQEGTLD